MLYYLTHDGSGNITGNGASADGTLPSGAMECTQEQYATASNWKVQAGVLVAYTPPAPTLTPAEQAAAQLTAGVAVTSTSTPALNGTYACDPLTQGRIASISVYILVNGNFPGGLSAYPWPDMGGTPHTFPTTTAFQGFASAIADYVAALDMIVATGAGTLPSASIALA